MRWLRRIIFTILFLLILASLIGWTLLTGSRARLDGTLALPGLSAPVNISRDRLGVATLEAGNRRDLAYALGFLHAQERFFEMDLMRRNAAGELAQLVGSAALDLDLNHRRHRFRARAQAAITGLSSADRALFSAYRDGVNEGLSSLRVRPWEYLLLRSAPEPWRDEDSLLVVHTMFLDLNQDGTNVREIRLSQMRAAFPAAAFDFLLARDGAHEAPLQGALAPAASIPGPDILNLRLDPVACAPIHIGDDLRRGSNNFAIAGAFTGDGALVANDMHLALRAPNIWFRARLRYPDPQTPGSAIDLNGLTLPGMPALVAGSNGHVAWGYTNSYGDWLDWVRVEQDPGDASRYRVPEGWARIETHVETIGLKGGKPQSLSIKETRWGPIMGKDADGTAIALGWIAHEPRVFNLNLMQMERVRSVREALDLGPTIGMPPQNLVVGDAEGHIGWTITGNALPLRAGFNPAMPGSWSGSGTGWIGFAAPAQYPRIEDPLAGRLWTANNRTTSDAWLALLGDGGYDNGARAMQIRDGLFARNHFEPADLMAVQLDDRSLFLSRWQQLLQEVLAKTDEPRLAELRRLTGSWSGRAAAESIDYRLVRTFRQYVREAVLAPFVGRVKAQFSDFGLPPMYDGEAPVWELLQDRPIHMLDPRYADWNALLQAAAQRVVDTLGGMPGGLASRTWGERNTAAIRHMISSSLPSFLSRFLDMPPDQLPGDTNMPRAQGPGFGASERFVIMPGHEDRSLLHMPGGQSDHPLSPFYGAGHEDWAQGRATPLLPGPEEHRLVLTPLK
jgi:penicillin G amidase